MADRPSPDLSRRARGKWGEDRACSEYRRRGFEIVERNWRSPDQELPGEIDVIARDADVLVFCEVKARRNADHGGAAAAVDARKQAQVRELAECWLRLHDTEMGVVRFDVVAIDGVRLRLYEDAF